MSTPDPLEMAQIFADAEARRAPLHRIGTDIQGMGIDLFVGNRRAASDLALLSAYGIKTVLNCAINLDINYVSDRAADSGALAFGRAPVRYHKVGLIDGPGNPAAMILAGYLQLKGLIRQKMPDKPNYPSNDPGHVLINCRGGRSRSVIIGALFLHLELPERYSTLNCAIEHVRRSRELEQLERPYAPNPALIEAAHWAADAMRRIQQERRAPGHEP